MTDGFTDASRASGSRAIDAQVALVTGGTRGIGRAISERLSKRGFAVAAVFVNDVESAKQCEAELGIRTYRWDIGDWESCQAGVRDVERELGAVDVLVNNAGVTRDAFLHRSTIEMWRDVMRVNLDSAFHMTRLVIDGMRERGYGRVVNISSINGQRGQAGQANYSAAKAGIIGFTKALAQESARKGITVNCIAPGYVDTDMVASIAPTVLSKIVAEIPTGRLGRADEIASMVAFLASEEAAFINGATMTVNGAHYLAG